MKKYIDLIDQTFEFPQHEFRVINNELYFYDIPLLEIIKKHGTPLKLSYLPKIGQNITFVRSAFEKAIKKYNYSGTYTYCYCTKSSHFQFILKEILKNDAHIETSSHFDIPIIKKMYQQSLLKKDTLIICNGFKKTSYKKAIVDLINDGFKNCFPILDNLKELDYYEENIKVNYNIGIRIAADEEPNFEFYTSRLGIRYGDINHFYLNKIKPSKRISLKILHFFINTGIRDSAYYWSELSRFVFKYCELKKVCPELDSIDIGGGFPIKTSLQFEFDYEYMIEQIIENIKWICGKNNVPVPNIITEFGSYTVGESGLTLFSILDEKLQNDKELWYMIDGSFITHIPDTWAVNQKFILLPINKWDNEYHKVNVGGLTCDSLDYYNSEAHSSEVFLPKIDDNNHSNPLFVGFFHTGAYQESLGGNGGIHHCLVPSCKHVLVDLDENKNYYIKVFANEQDYDSMLNTLGY